MPKAITRNTDSVWTVLWRAMQDQDWLSSEAIVALCADSPYAAGTVRRAISQAPIEMIERKMAPKDQTQRPWAKVYRLQPNYPMPTEPGRRATKQQMAQHLGRPKKAKKPARIEREIPVFVPPSTAPTVLQPHLIWRR